MEVITFEAEAYKKLQRDLYAIHEKLELLTNTKQLKEVWFDNQEACQALKISKRTLQHYRDSDMLPYAQIGAKIYYKAIDLDAFLNDSYTKKCNDNSAINPN